MLKEMAELLRFVSVRAELKGALMHYLPVVFPPDNCQDTAPLPGLTPHRRLTL